MIFYKNGSWHLCSEKVRYTQHGEGIIQYVMSEGRDWWIDFAERWDHTEIVEFIEVAPTAEQVKRYNDILQLNLPDGFGGTLSEYVELGIYPEGFDHTLRSLQIIEQQVLQDEYLIDNDFRLSLIEMGLIYNDIYRG